MEELIKIQGELVAPKDQVNNFGGYKYRSTESILTALKPLLTKYNCFINITDDMVLVGNRFYVKAIATLTNKDGKTAIATAFAREEESRKGMDSSQITGATSSYARKYALNGLFAIDDTKDADATNDHGKGDDANADDKPWFSDEQLSVALETIKNGDFSAWGSKEKMMESIFSKFKVNKKHRDQLLK